MKSQNYIYTYEDSASDMTSYEEQLLLNYDDYLESGFVPPLTASNHYNLEPGELEEDLEDDLESEYDENDWEEMDDENEEDPGTFLMMR
ncbi:hypothetical protein [Flavobacterium sp. CLA17]|uniref:hypothetical protein n=1 Tax=Flavobacterium sp. CLA17 TaxID=2724135 RepID=UPI001491E194|nr:hypothetical protein [Flavobacterium sp. CLA17]QSB25439.1 hypothetical protein HAV12_013760 [Flavobacterium sp. CLA17]